MKKTIYIAGKVTGLEFEEVTQKFAAAENMLIEQGWQKVVNPITLINNPSEEWHSAMEKCLFALKDCQAIYMLPCSVDSPGAKLELQYALDNKLDVYYELENVDVEPEISE
jgi:hypothetical protein